VLGFLPIAALGLWVIAVDDFLFSIYLSVAFANLASHVFI
jgi:hypothetical protein